jgi:hypothetical protein
MAVITVRPTKFDVTVANAIAAHTVSHIEQVAGALTWGADARSRRVGGWRATTVRK